jgi:hypothetical protein
MRHLLLTLFVALISGVALAQEEDKIQKKETPKRTGWVLNTTLSSLTEPEAGPAVGLEYRFSESVSVALDGTAILYTLPDVYDYGTNRSGYRLRPEIKFYPSWWRNERRNFYVSLMGTYKDVRYDELFYNFQDDKPYTVRQKKISRAISANIGIQRYIGSARRFMIELYVGTGIRFRRTTPGYEEGYVEDEYELRNLSIDEDGYNPQFAFGFKLGYRF